MNHPIAVRSLLLLSYLVAIATADLVHVSVVFRHGHRSPMMLLPSQNFTVENTWRDGLGQLTNIGKNNELELGQFLRKSAHYARSTDVDRTLMSAQVCLAGLFPPLGDQQWAKDLAWQPIPVHTVAAAEDFLLGSPEYPCPERERQFSRMRSDPVRLKFYDAHAAFLDRLTRGAGMSVDANSVHSVLDTLWINKIAGLPAPAAWLNYSGSDWDRLVTLGSYQWREYSWTPDLVRFGSGVFLDEVLGVMDNISRGFLPDRGAQLRLYSDHDTTVASVQAALGNADFVWPNFASALLFELHSEARAGQFSLQAWLRNNTAGSLIALPLPGCPKAPQACPLASALSGLAQMRLSPDQLRQRCRTGRHPSGWPDFLESHGLLVLSGCLLLLTGALLALFAGAQCRRQRLRERNSGILYRPVSGDLER